VDDAGQAQPALRQVTLKIRPSEMVALIGPSEPEVNPFWRCSGAPSANHVSLAFVAR